MEHWKDWIGWIATAVFAVSYLCKSDKHLRIVQACAAGLWIIYGFVVGAVPVIVANTIVAIMAVIVPVIKSRLSSPVSSDAQ